MIESRFLRLYQRELHRFKSAFESSEDVDIKLVDRVCPKGTSCSDRDYGYCTYGQGPLVITYVRRILLLPEAKILGLLRHELGHAFDPDIRHDGAEQRADDIAEWVTGERIRYDENDIQTVGRGKYPRPLYLHR